MASKKVDLNSKPFDSQIVGSWDGSVEKGIIFTEIYIQDKYSKNLHTLKNVTVSLANVEQENKPSRLEFDFLDWNTGEGLSEQKLTGNEEIIQRYAKLYRKTDKRFTYFPMDIAYYDKNIERIIGHSIFAFYDKKVNEVEIFDSIPGEIKPYKQNLKTFFKTIYGNEVSIIFPGQFGYFGNIESSQCWDGLYKYNSKGFCLVWSLWYLELRLNNPELSRQEITRKAMKTLRKTEDHQKICKLLRGYAQFIDKFTKDYTIERNNKHLILRIKKKTNYLIPKILITTLGLTGAVVLIIKKLNLKNRAI
jgi:hypothetical protein